MLNLSKLVKDEPPVSQHIPFSHHYDAQTICNKDGTLFQIIAIQGIPFETIDDIDIVAEKQSRNEFFSSINDELTGIYTYTLRREEKSVPEGEFEPGSFADDLNQAYMDVHGQRKAYINEHYIVIARKPHSGAQGAIKELLNVFYKPHKKQLELEYQDRLESLSRVVSDVIKRLKDYAPRLLSVIHHIGQPISEPLSFLNRLINHQQTPILLPKMDLSRYLPVCRHFFGHETIEIRDAHTTRFSAILSIKEYGSPTDAGMLDSLLEQPIEMTISQSFMPIDKQRALKLLDDAQRMLIQSEDYAESQADELQAALDDLASGRLSIGEHTFNVMVLADSLDALVDHVATIYSELGVLGGLRPVREDLNLENAFWSILPGNGAYVTRGTPITSKNFAGFASFHNQPGGKRDDNHWGPAVSVLSTQQGTPYFINFHDHDLGHTTLLGPSGYGKTLLLCFLLAQSMKYTPRMIYLDYERGAEIFIRAIKGQYRIISSSNKTGWNPLQLPDTGENRAFLEQWLIMLLTPNGEDLSAEEREVIKRTVDGNYNLPLNHRTLHHIAPFLGTGMASSLAGRLQQWVGTGQRAYLFDNQTDDLVIDLGDKDNGVIGFDMTHLLKDEIGRKPAFLYLYHRIEQSLDGYPTMIPIDEAWAYFKDAYFAQRLEENLKVMRRKNAMFIMGTNDVTDAAHSSISSTIITQSATNIFFGNIKADVNEYKKFGLTEKEIDVIKSIKRNDHLFLLKQGHDSVVLKLDLTGLEHLIPVLSSNEKNIQRLNKIRKISGDDPANWLPQLINDKSIKEGALCVA